MHAARKSSAAALHGSCSVAAAAATDDIANRLMDTCRVLDLPLPSFAENKVDRQGAVSNSAVDTTGAGQGSSKREPLFQCECVASVDVLPGNACKLTAAGQAGTKKAAKAAAVAHLLDALQLLAERFEAGKPSAPEGAPAEDSISRLNRLAQQSGLPLPGYEAVATEGAGTHEPLWQATVTLQLASGRAVSATGTSLERTKQAAKRRAADALLANEEVSAALQTAASGSNGGAEAGAAGSAKGAADAGEAHNYVSLLQVRRTANRPFHMSSSLDSASSGISCTAKAIWQPSGSPFAVCRMLIC